MILSLVSLAALLMSPVQAGDRIGNGGDAVVCTDGTPVRLLDFHEAKRRGISVEMGSAVLSVSEKVGLALDRLSRIDPSRASKFRKSAIPMLEDIAAFEKNPSHPTTQIRFTDDVLSDVDDSEETALPPGCEKRQLVIRVRAVFPEDRPFEFYRPLWIQMDSEQKALTVLHELWYGETLEDGANDSRLARYMNGLVASPSFESLRFSEYVSLLRLARDRFQTVIPYYRTVCGLGLSLSFSGIGLVSEDVRDSFGRRIQSGGVDLLPHSVSFDEGAEITGLTGRLATPVGRQLAVRSTQIHFKKPRADFYPEFTLDSACAIRSLDPANVIDVKVDGQTGRKNPAKIEWDETGRYIGE